MSIVDKIVKAVAMLARGNSTFKEFEDDGKSSRYYFRRKSKW